MTDMMDMYKDNRPTCYSNSLIKSRETFLSAILCFTDAAGLELKGKTCGNVTIDYMLQQFQARGGLLLITVP